MGCAKDDQLHVVIATPLLFLHHPRGEGRDLLLLLEAGLVLAGVESDCGAALLKPVDESDLVGGARGLSFSRGGLLADKAQELLVVVGVL